MQHQFLTKITRTGSQDVEGKELELEEQHKLGESSLSCEAEGVVYTAQWP